MLGTVGEEGDAIRAIYVVEETLESFWHLHFVVVLVDAVEGREDSLEAFLLFRGS